MSYISVSKVAFRTAVLHAHKAVLLCVPRAMRGLYVKSRNLSGKEESARQYKTSATRKNGSIFNAFFICLVVLRANSMILVLLRKVSRFELKARNAQRYVGSHHHDEQTRFNYLHGAPNIGFPLEKAEAIDRPNDRPGSNTHKLTTVQNILLRKILQRRHLCYLE